jgi:ABC-type sugar transport system permease subunit
MVVYPIIYSAVLSFVEWDGISKEKVFVWLNNFKYVFNDEFLPLAMKNNAIWMSLFVPIPVLIGFFLALILQKNSRINVIFRSIFYLPMILSFTVMFIMWSWIYEPTRGVITQLFLSLSLPPPTRSLLTRPDTSLIAIAIVGIWHWIGFPLVLYLAALKDIPKELFENADIEGATKTQVIRLVIIPLVRHASLVAIAIGIVLSLKVFDLVFLMAGGYYKNDVLSTLIWKLAFERYLVGPASAVAIIQFLIVGIILVPYLWINVTKRGVDF